MTDNTTAEQAEQGLTELIESLGALRNANTRDAGFRTWRQKALTLLQRIWPNKPARAQRFRRVAFAPGVGVNDEALFRECYEKGYTEARRLLQFWLAEIKLNGLEDHDGPIDPDEDAFTMPLADEGPSGAHRSRSPGLGIEKAEFQVESAPGETSASPSLPDAGVEPSSRSEPGVPAGSAGATASELPSQSPASRIASTPTRIESPIQAAAEDDATTSAAPPRMGEILQFPTPPPHAPEFRGLDSKPKGKAAHTGRASKDKSGRTRLRDMLGIDGKTGVSPATPTAATPTAAPTAAAPTAAAPTAAAPTAAAPTAAAPTAAAPTAATPTAAAPTAATPTAPTPTAATPTTSTPTAATRPATTAPSAKPGVTPSTAVRPTSSPGAAAAQAPPAPAPTQRTKGRGGKPLAPGTSVRSAPARASAHKSPEAARPATPPTAARPTAAPAAARLSALPAVAPPAMAQDPTPIMAPSPATEPSPPPQAERPGELVSAGESLREAMAGVFVTKPDLGDPSTTPATRENAGAGGTAARGETVIEFPAQAKKAASSRTSAGIPEIVALAADLGQLGVPAAEQGRVRAALLDLSRRLDAGKADWRLLQVGVSLVMRFPRLAARALPLLIPYFDRAA